MIRLAIVLLAIFFNQTITYASEPILFSKSDTYERFLYSDIKIKKGIASFWVLDNYFKPEITNKKIYMSEITHIIADCVDEKISSDQYVSYEKKFANGKIIDSGNIDSSFRNYVPGSIGESTYKIGCNKDHRLRVMNENNAEKYFQETIYNALSDVSALREVTENKDFKRIKNGKNKISLKIIGKGQNGWMLYKFRVINEGGSINVASEFDFSHKCIGRTPFSLFIGRRYYDSEDQIIGEEYEANNTDQLLALKDAPDYVIENLPSCKG